jgi:hypothetical protein
MVVVKDLDGGSQRQVPVGSLVAELAAARAGA